MKVKALQPDTADAARTAHEEFVALLIADEDLVSAEFQEIVTAEWPMPPSARPRGGAPSRRWPPQRRSHRRWHSWGAGTRPDPPCLARPTRERSPPPAATTPAQGSWSRPPRRPGPRPARPRTSAMNAEPGDLYSVLGVPADASQDQIDHAFRVLLRRHHPDTRQPGDASQQVLSDTALQDVFAAYRVLGDPARRVAYDRATAPVSRSAPAQPVVAVRTHRPSGRPPIVAGPVRWHPPSR